MSEYASYLSNLQNKATVVATEDIVSDKGMLIAKSGAALNSSSYETILKFKLLKPLEDSIAISNQLNPKLIYDRIIQLVRLDPWLKSINDKLGNKQALQRCCLQTEKYPLLLQKLTVLSMEITDVFNQAVLSAYLCHICALNDKLTQQEINDYFLAGLSHDIGFLHIDPNILSKTETLTAEEWRKIQSHPVISYEILKRIDKFPKRVSLAVLEHHENLDGTGYPRAKTAHDLCHLGQVVSLIDNVIAIYNKKFKPINRSPRGIMPIIQINMHSYFPDAVSVILRTLKQAPESSSHISDERTIQALIEHVIEEQAYISKIIDIIRENNDDLGFVHNDKQVYAIQNIAINIIMITSSAGLSDNNYRDWLEELSSSKPDQIYNEVEETRLMLDEVAFQLQNYQKTANVFINKNPDHPMKEKVKATLDNFMNINRKAPPVELKKHWDNLAEQKISV